MLRTFLQNHIFVPIPSKGLDFHQHMSWSFCVFNNLMLEVVVHCVAIGYLLSITIYTFLSYLSD